MQVIYFYEEMKLSNPNYNQLLDAQSRIASTIQSSTDDIHAKLKSFENSVKSELNDTKERVDRTRKNNDEDIFRRGGQLNYRN